jgi:hypothetical protein
MMGKNRQKVIKVKKVPKIKKKVPKIKKKVPKVPKVSSA